MFQPEDSQLYEFFYPRFYRGGLLTGSPMGSTVRDTTKSAEMPVTLRCNMRYLSLAITLLFIAALTSCEKEVHINMSSSPSQLVVQGAVESGQPPYVFLTSTISFFSKVDLSTLENSFIHGADIKVSDGSKTITLREYTFDTGTANKFYIYTIDTATLGDIIIGEAEKTYSLTITHNGKVYSAVSKIPSMNGVDSMWFAEPLLRSPRTPDSAKQLFANFTDPDTPGNYVRYFTRRNSQQFFAGDQFNDEVVNGKPLTNIPLFAGFQNTGEMNNDSLRYFYKGDTVTLRWSGIDRRVYQFWNTFSYARSALGNPFASPINLQTNISGGALGIWAGYGNVEKTLVVP